MRQLKIQIRLYIAEKLLIWAVGVSPKGKEGEKIVSIIYHYFKSVLVKP